jgi:transposase-like protein
MTNATQPNRWRVVPARVRGGAIYGWRLMAPDGRVTDALFSTRASAETAAALAEYRRARRENEE